MSSTFLFGVDKVLLRALLSSLLLDETGIPPLAFSVAPSLKSGQYNPPPVYIVHGTIDELVPHRQATDVVAALKEINARVVYDELEGLNHLFDKDVSYRMESMYSFILNL